MAWVSNVLLWDFLPWRRDKAAFSLQEIIEKFRAYFWKLRKQQSTAVMWERSWRMESEISLLPGSGPLALPIPDTHLRLGQ